MENLKLTSEEKKELEKRGFLVKNILPWRQYFTALFSHFSFYLLGSIFLYLISLFIIGVATSLLNVPFEIIDGIMTILSYPYFFVAFLGMIFLPIYITYKFAIFRRIMVSNKGDVVGNNNNYGGLSSVPIKILEESKKINKVGGDFISYYLIKFPKLEGVHLRHIFPIIVVWLGLTCITGALFLTSIFLSLIGSVFVIFADLLIPLNKFTNLGEKIQNITPTIESQSKLIQSEFEKDQNFGVLHAGFEKLSSTFSEIVRLVIKLEQVEKKANKGNLFDSEKYIDSLRSDIIVPLEELQKFLEGRRDELVMAQEELSRVRVGGSDERGNRKLSSTRSEALLEELDTNIRALSEMRGKMGK